jgi:8-oxo-dGTP diphosphatase
MTTYSWHVAAVPADLPVRQVYGWIFDSAGRVVIWRERGHTGLPGGRPEAVDVDAEATLRREVWEEVTAEIDDPRHLGYQRVEQPGRPPFAQLRMIARLARLHPPAPDPDTGRVKERLLVPPAAAAHALAWGEHGRQQARAAARLARRCWNPG